jgi:site-specific DNA-methyltransferase (adenine-specific)
MREILPTLDIRPDCAVIDPPYAETSLAWDRWPDGWPALVAKVTSSMWCFGSMRVHGEHWSEFRAAGWKSSQDVVGTDHGGEPLYGDVHIVWEKQNGSGPCPSDRFMRVHEHALHWYLGPWSKVYHDQQRMPWSGPDKGSVNTSRPARYHETGGRLGANTWTDDGTRVMRSVLRIQSLHQRGIHPTEKPTDLLKPLIEYACPPGGLVLDPFAGSGSTAEAARLCGRRAVLVEADERYCEAVARRLAQDVLPIGGAR